MFDFSHQLHATPLIHLVCQLIVVWKTIFVSSISKRMTIEFPSDSLPADISSNNTFVMNEAFHNWHNMGVLCPNINN